MTPPVPRTNWLVRRCCSLPDRHYRKITPARGLPRHDRVGSRSRRGPTQPRGPSPRTREAAVTNRRGAVRRLGSLGLSLAILAVVASCGGGSPGPTSPTPATSPYPMMVGSWRGTLTVEQLVTPGSGERTVSLCNETWVITTQTEGRFSGTFQAEGVCAHSGTMFGTVSISGAITGLTFSAFVGSPGETSTCRRVSGDGVYAGVLSGTSLTAQTAERTVCAVALLTFDRSYSLSMRKQ